MELNWNKCQNDVWCPLNTVNLEHAHFNNMAGVYLIWHGGENAHTVRVGQGFIRDRLKEHRKESDIQKYQNLGLFVTWASVAATDRNGVEAYLADKLNPLVGERFPNVTQISVNLPWK